MSGNIYANPHRSTPAADVESPANKRIRQLSDVRHLLLDIAQTEAPLWTPEQLKQWAAGHAKAITRIIAELKADALNAERAGTEQPAERAMRRGSSRRRPPQPT